MTSAPRGYRPLKTGAGRPTAAPRKVPDVETVPCPQRDGPHWLRNSSTRGGPVTACVGCGLSWSELDAELRAGVRA